MNLHRSVSARRAAVVVAAVLACGPQPAATAAPEPIAVLTCDAYADLRSQLTWVGEQVGNPTLAGFAESFILLATQGKGLAGLDVKRPAGVMITAEGGPVPTIRALVPVKDLDRLLGAIQGMTGPVEKGAEGVRRISPPGSPAIEITEQDGWAILSQAGSPADVGDPLEVIEPLAKDYTLAIELFPARMPAEMRDRLRGAIDQAAQAAEAQGQPMDDAVLRGVIDNLDQIESLLVGLAVDTSAADIHLDITTKLVDGPDAVANWGLADGAVGSIGKPATADGKPAALRGHYVTTVPAGTEAAVREGLDRALDVADDDPALAVVTGVLRDAVAAMIDTGAIDAGFTVDTSAADGESPLPAITIGMKIKDGAAFEKLVKERLGKTDSLAPGVTVAFDTGRHAGASLHELTLDTAAIPGGGQLVDRAVVTLAISPDRVHLLVGGDVKKRLDEAVAHQAAEEARPFVGVEASLAAMVGYAARMKKAFQPDDPQGEALGMVAEQAADKDSTAIRLSVKPVDRGLTIRLSADAGALQTVAASTSPAPRTAPLTPLRPADGRQEPAREGGPSLAP
ncbi:MAG: hypothetical protein FJ286_09735 [Planctomycetes bacterium]|nr:hypothetical protein [Planctomycetota bacterium]